MAAGLEGGTSFMEDYTYHLPSGGMPGAWVPTCWRSARSIAAGKPSCEIHPLGIGGKEDPVRLVFDVPPGPAVNATVVDLGNRFRMVLNEVDVHRARTPAREVAGRHGHSGIPSPTCKTAAAAWIYAGGSHHPVFSQALTHRTL